MCLWQAGIKRLISTISIRTFYDVKNAPCAPQQNIAAWNQAVIRGLYRFYGDTTRV